jgi:uncharacterized membrane protein SpoIIM required for sporulation
VDYAGFLRLRGPVWERFEAALTRARDGALPYEALEELADAYRHVLHDHALASARYPGTGAARRLQALALAGTAALTTAERRAGEPFFTRTFPAAFRRLVPWFAISVGLFVLGGLLGATLAWMEPSLGLALLGPSAEAGLREGRLWTESLLHAVPPSVTGSAIATNNMSVAITAFAGGALAGVGAVYVVVMNGFLLGAVFACTAHYGLALRLGEFVAAHGPLEISLILVAAGAGLSMGHALVAPDDRPRGVAVAEAGRTAVVVLAGCLPWFLVLGFVESFVSPSPLLAPSVKVALGLALLGLFLAPALFPARPEDPRP